MFTPNYALEAMQEAKEHAKQVNSLLTSNYSDYMLVATDKDFKENTKPNIGSLKVSPEGFIVLIGGVFETLGQGLAEYEKDITDSIGERAPEVIAAFRGALHRMVLAKLLPTLAAHAPDFKPTKQDTTTH